MIVFGRKVKLLNSETLIEKCSNCHTQNSVRMNIVQKYFHVFWIPFVPTSKAGVTQCDHCKQVLEQKEFDEVLLQEFNSLKSRTKTPVWMFSGMVLLGLFIALITFNTITNRDDRAKYVASPKVGDIYEVKKTTGEYTIYKIYKLSNDTILFLPSKYITNKITGIYDLINKGDEAYLEEPTMSTKAELKQMDEDGKIIKVHRK